MSFFFFRLSDANALTVYMYTITVNIYIILT